MQDCEKTHPNVLVSLKVETLSLPTYLKLFGNGVNLVLESLIVAQLDAILLLLMLLLVKVMLLQVLLLLLVVVLKLQLILVQLLKLLLLLSVVLHVRCCAHQLLGSNSVAQRRVGV